MDRLGTVEHIYVGSADDAENLDPRIAVLCVREGAVRAPHSIYVPIIHGIEASDDEISRMTGIVDMRQLYRAAWIIEAVFWQARQSLLVHCGAGQERAPLAVVWWMHIAHGATLDAAYAEWKAARPMIQDRRLWLPSDPGSPAPEHLPLFH